MSLDVYLEEYKPVVVFNSNITHNLTKMAQEAGIYYACWRPEEINKKLAEDIIPILEAGLSKLKADPTYFKQFDAENGWGVYENFVNWVAEYLTACKEHPNATIRVWR